MGDDIRVDIHFLDNLKTRKLLRELGDHGVVCMLRVWLYAARRHPKGALEGISRDDLEEVAGWSGAPGVFADYALRMRWALQDASGTLVIKDWKDHQPWIYWSDKRSEAARTAAEARWEKKKKRGGNASRMHGACEPHAGGNAPSPNPSPSPIPKDLIQGAPANRSSPSLWPEDMLEIQNTIRELELERSNLDDPKWWREIEGWVKSTGLKVYILTELRNWKARQSSLSENQRATSLKRSFRNWLAKAIAWEENRDQRKAIRETRPAPF